MTSILRPLSVHVQHSRAFRTILLNAATSQSRTPLFLARANLWSGSKVQNNHQNVNSFSSAASSLQSDHLSRKSNNEDPERFPPPCKRMYSWIDAEAESLIAKAYERHLYKPTIVNDKQDACFPPSLVLDNEEMEKLSKPQHYKPRDWVDRTAHGLMKFLRVFTHAFFREKYDHHAVTLETVAAVPGIVGAFHRHLRSLRNMRRDHGWIKDLLEESENERMHLLIFMKVTNPSRLERAVVMLAQAAYLSFYSGLYLLSGRAAHRLVGYLEEEAFQAYTDYLNALDSGRLKMKPAPEIAREYYRLPDNATIRDVVLHVRSDEAYHRDTNHYFANKYRKGDLDSPVVRMSKNAVEEAGKSIKRQ